MAVFGSFEDIEAWQKGRELVKKIYTVTARGDFAKDFGLKDQIQRASISIISNIAEGFDRGGDKEFIQFLAVAKGSAGEVRAQLYAAIDLGYISSAEFEEASKLVNDIRHLIGGLITYLKGSTLKGYKYK